jgi:alpha-L-fucosidase 2
MKACIGVILIVVTYCYCDVICNDVSKFNVKWTSISNDSRGSMPIGNGDVALNVWTQSDGIYYYIAKNDAWSETSRLLKIGGIKIIFDPNPFDGGPFSQILDLATGRINITAGGITSLLWVDANSPVISMTFESTTIAQFKVFVEPIIWRKSNHTLTGEELQSARGVCGNIVEPADIVLTSNLNGNPTISWYHRNTDPNNVFRRSLQRQGLDNSDLPDPLLYLAFGATLTGESTSFDGKRLISRYDSSLKRFYVSVSCQKAQSGSDFIFSTFKTLNHHISNTEKKLSSHIDWWNAFWNRSCIQIDSLMNVTSFYILERWMEITGGGRGKYPLKFNGLLYNTDVFDDSGKVLYNADYRKWGGGYWFQNTRFMYWAMLASGDLESMMPLFDTFMNIIPLAQLRTRRYYGHDGVYIPETFWFWGTFIDLLVL